MHAAADEAVALHRSQRLREHLLGDRLKLGEQLVIAVRPMAEGEQHVDGPLGGQQADRLADEPPGAGALGAATGRDRGAIGLNGHRYRFPDWAIARASGPRASGSPARPGTASAAGAGSGSSGMWRTMKPLVGGCAASEIDAGRRREGVARRQVRGGHGERERHGQRDGAGEVHERLATGAAADGHSDAAASR